LTAFDSLTPVLLAQALGTALLSGALFAAGFRYRRCFLHTWALSAAGLSVSIAAGAALRSADVGEGPREALNGLALSGKLALAVWLVAGLAQLQRESLRPGGYGLGVGVWFIVVVAGAVLGALLPPSLLLWVAASGAAEAIAAGVFAHAAWTFRGLGRSRGGVGPAWLAVTFALAAFEALRHAAVLLANRVGAPLALEPEVFGFVDIFLGAGFGAGVLALLLEDETAERAVGAERAQAALQALRDSEQRQRFVLDHVDEVIWSSTRDPATGRLRLSSLIGRVREIVGCSPDQLLAQPDLFRVLVHPDDLPGVQRAWKQTAASRLPTTHEYRLRHPDGSEYRWFEDRVTPQFDERGVLVGLFGVVRDVTERKRAAEALRRSEEQVRQAQKMEAVGRLAGGIAHDFNNVLTVVAGHTDLMLETMSETDPRWADAKAIEKAVARAAALVRQLLVFSRRQMLHPQVLDVSELLNDLQGMLTRLIGEDVRLTTAIDATVGHVRADRSQFEQVVVNLVVNARDAMPDGGAIVVELRDSGGRDDPVLERLGAPPGQYVVLAVHDTGVGIDADTRARLFEPFFTTKPPGKGTGLGLATAYGIVRQSHGFIDVRSEAGRGASFSVYLPLVDAPPGDAAAEGDAPAQDHTASADDQPTVVLVVEDEDAVRAFVVAALRSRGHVVLEASSGADALALAMSHEGPIDLLLTDVVMPGMRGSELAQRLRSARPDSRIVFMTGYTDDATWHMAKATGHLVIAKPFTADGLAQVVRDALYGQAVASPPLQGPLDLDRTTGPAADAERSGPCARRRPL
jgi:PAS domain S-box-containing protein